MKKTVIRDGLSEHVLKFCMNAHSKVLKISDTIKDSSITVEDVSKIKEKKTEMERLICSASNESQNVISEMNKRISELMKLQKVSAQLENMLNLIHQGVQGICCTWIVYLFASHIHFVGNLIREGGIEYFYV